MKRARFGMLHARTPHLHPTCSDIRASFACQARVQGLAGYRISLPEKRSAALSSSRSFSGCCASRFGFHQGLVGSIGIYRLRSFHWCIACCILWLSWRTIASNVLLFVLTRTASRATFGKEMRDFLVGRVPPRFAMLSICICDP